MNRLFRTILPVFLAIGLLAGNAYAAEPLGDVQADDGVSVTITDITPQDNGFEGELPKFLPLDITAKTEDGVKLLVKTYEVSGDVEPEDLVESGLEQNGVEYRLRDILHEALPGSSEKRTESQLVTLSSDSDIQADILPLLPEYLEYDEGGYTGRLTLEAETISTEVESSGTYSYTISGSRDFYGLERNDPYYIPKTITQNGAVLSLADIKWTPGGSENEQSPTYSATATYTGKASGSKPNGYLVTARYSGIVERPVAGNIRYSLIYEAIPAPILPESFNWTPIFITLGCLAAAGCLFFLVVFLRQRMPMRKKAVAGMDGFDSFSELEENAEREKPHFLGNMKRDIAALKENQE